MFRLSTTPIIRSTNLSLQPPVLVIIFVQLPPSSVARLAWPRWREVVAVPEAVVTVLCTAVDT